MRRRFLSALTELADADSRIVLLTADVGYTVVEPFRDAHPDRFFNVGVAEQNAVGLATGLAEAGYLPFVYSMATFASMRPYEFVRNGPVLHKLPVRLIGVGGGYEYGSAGHSHHALEDVGLLRMQPGVTIYTPSNAAQAAGCLLHSWDDDGVVYYRLSKLDAVTPAEGALPFDPSGLQVLREGGPVLILAMGAAGAIAESASKLLAERGCDCSLGVVSRIQPVPTAVLRDLLSRHSLVCTVEAHYAGGALGTVVAELIAEEGLAVRLQRCAARAAEDGRCGGDAWHLSRDGLTAEAVAAAVSATIGAHAA